MTDVTITRNRNEATYRVDLPTHMVPFANLKEAAKLAVENYGLTPANEKKFYSLVRGCLASADVLTIDPVPHGMGVEFDINFTRTGDPLVHYVGFDAVVKEGP